jgi:cyclophilin family peptidyl-prolyl cis-trans isomerase/HEAT repeat protein
MRKNLFVSVLSLLITSAFFTATIFAQKPKAVSSDGLTVAVQVQILKAEDERRWDATLESLMKSQSPAVRKRAALAAGRIGNELSIPALSKLLEQDADAGTRAMAAFALGETESPKAADAILQVLANEKENDEVRARAIEAAGKIGAADKPSAAKLGEAILDALELESTKAMQNKQLIRLGLTAVLRVRPEEGDFVTAKFLNNLDTQVRINAGNTMARLRSKNANDALAAMLMSDDDAVARANAARALGAAEDMNAMGLLLEAATQDEDQRVRVSAVRALGSLKDAKAAPKLLEHGRMLFAAYRISKLQNPLEKNELLEIAVVLGRLLTGTNDEDALKFISDVRERDGFVSPETEIAYMRISPAKFFKLPSPKVATWQTYSAFFQGLGALATMPETDETKELKKLAGAGAVAYITHSMLENNAEDKALSDALTTLAALKVADELDEVLRDALKHNDPNVRATVAGLIADQPPSKENFDALRAAFISAMLKDKTSDDAQLAILDAMFKLDKKESVGVALTALAVPDYLVRKKALELLRAPELVKDYPGLPASLENASKKKQDQVGPYNAAFGTKLGQVLNTTADYTRAATRKNGQAKAIVTTEKGAFTIELLAEDAPLTVDNFIKLAKSNYFNNVSVHRVVPNFVMQDGDPRGDGNGGPGWSIRCEINTVPFDRGAIGMALSGKDTGGSQWFATHSAQPHLDGGYTVFGRVSETDMKVVDSIARGDKIISIKIVEGTTTTGRKK